MMELPLVIDIKRYSFEDGPGIRSVVFFKGCPLRCIFCHNPEAQKPGPEIAFSEAQCVECGACEQACPLGAVDLEFPGESTETGVIGAASARRFVQLTR